MEKVVFANEAEFQARVVEAAKRLRLLPYHTHRSERSERGFPDLVIVGHSGVLYRELKMPAGRLSREQQQWLYALTEAGQDAAVWLPMDWPDRVLSEMRGLGRLRGEQVAPTAAQVRRSLRRL